MDDIVSLIRMCERLIIVGFGGLAIYLGYRLFLLLPVQTDSTGKLQLPGYSVVFSRVGPGIFFAAFGALVLYHSLSEKIIIRSLSDNHKVLQGTEAEEMVLATPRFPHVSDKLGPQDKVAEIRLRIQILNCIGKRGLHNQSDYFKHDLTLAVRDSKIALLGSIWSEDRWGKFKPFLAWAQVENSKLPVSKEVQNLFTGIYPDCMNES